MPTQHRETIVKHQKSTAVSVSQVTSLAIELSRLPDATVGPSFEENCSRAFDALIKYQAMLNKIQAEDPEP